MDQIFLKSACADSKNPLSDKLLLNKGSNDGLKAGDAVIDQYGLIGQISAVQP
ncbi:MAG: rod shape-determining protein MreC, partial [Haemophilus parainfluenzae]